MKVYQIVFFFGSLGLAVASGWNIFFSRSPEFQNVMYFAASLIMIYSSFYNSLFPGERIKLQKKREEANRKRNESKDSSAINIDK